MAPWDNLFGGAAANQFPKPNKTPAPTNAAAVPGQVGWANQLMYQVSQAVYKTQAEQYAEAEKLNASGSVYLTPPIPNGRLHSSEGPILTFPDGSVYYAQSGTVGHIAPTGPAPEIEDGIVIYCTDGRTGQTIVVRSPNERRAMPQILVGNAVINLSKDDIAELVKALLEAGSVRREESHD